MAAQPTPRDGDIGSPVEVHGYRYGLLKLCQWCGSEDDTAARVGMWTRAGGTRCEVRRLSA